MDTKLIVEGLALLAAGEQIMIRGPVAVDLSDVHEWATEVTVYRGDTGTTAHELARLMGVIERRCDDVVVGAIRDAISRAAKLIG